MKIWGRRKGEQPVSWKITRSCLSLIFESAKEIYPREFAALLRVYPERRDTISEIMLLPGTISGDAHAIFMLHMRPIDFSIVGTVHSHPSTSWYPSEADLHLFRKYGRIHLIVAYPFKEDTWGAYDYRGNPIEVKVI